MLYFFFYFRRIRTLFKTVTKILKRLHITYTHLPQLSPSLTTLIAEKLEKHLVRFFPPYVLGFVEIIDKQM